MNYFVNKSLFLVSSDDPSNRSKVAAGINLEKISQNSQENTCIGVSFFNKITGLRPATLLKKKLWQTCFPVNFVKFLRRPVLQNITG